MRAQALRAATRGRTIRPMSMRRCVGIRARGWASAGVGGFVLFGDLPVTLRAKLARIVASAGSVAPFIASDEEGGGVQRLKSLLGPLPVADLKVRGKFISSDGRAFSHDSAAVGSYVSAWDAGMRRVGVAAVVKH